MPRPSFAQTDPIDPVGTCANSLRTCADKEDVLPGGLLCAMAPVMEALVRLLSLGTPRQARNLDPRLVEEAARNCTKQALAVLKVVNTQQELLDRLSRALTATYDMQPEPTATLLFEVLTEAPPHQSGPTRQRACDREIRLDTFLPVLNVEPLPPPFLCAFGLIQPRDPLL